MMTKDELIDMWGSAFCEQCGEGFTGRINEEVGEFVSGDGTHLICHAQCGLNAGMRMA